MNQFTRKELELIEEIIAWHGSTPPDWIEPFKSVIHAKVQSMIDNYCEHEWENTCCGCCLSAIRCLKCDKGL